MSQSAGGVVKLDRFELMCLKLAHANELALANELARKAKLSFGAGGFFSKAQPALDWLKEQKKNVEFQQAVNRIAEMEATGALPSLEAVEAYRQTADGVATEIYWRTRKTHVEVSMQELQAAITSANALEVYLQLQEVLTDDHKSE